MARVSIILETRKTLSDGSHPLKARVTNKREQKYFTVKLPPPDEFDNLPDAKSKVNILGTLGVTKTDWEKIRGKSRRGGVYYDAQQELLFLENQVSEIVTQLEKEGLFTFDAFKRRLKGNNGETDESPTDLLTEMQTTATRLYEEGRIKTARGYESTINSIKGFHKKSKLPVEVITPEWLKAYEEHMISSDKKLTTIGIYLRNLRAAYKKIGNLQNYPFGREEHGKYSIPSGVNKKKALSLNEIKKIFNYQSPEGSTTEKCKDLWILSYLCNGANIKDLAFLKNTDVDEEVITFTRAKTARTKRLHPKQIEVPLTIEIAKLLDKYAQKEAGNEGYLLPILKKGMTPHEQQVAIDSTVWLINKHMKAVASELGIVMNLTTYVARHSFATVLKRSGASIEFISEALGHSNTKTTENYLSKFEIDKKREMHKHLTNWQIEKTNLKEEGDVNESMYN